MNFEEEIVGLKERKSELKGQIRSLDDEIQTFLILKDSGFETERTFEGKSGVKHTFNAYNPSNKCAVDWFNYPIDDTSVLATYAKFLDVGSEVVSKGIMVYQSFGASTNQSPAALMDLYRIKHFGFADHAHLRDFLLNYKPGQD